MEDLYSLLDMRGGPSNFVWELWQIHVAEQMILNDLEANPENYKGKNLSELTDTEEFNEENSVEYTKAYYKKTLIPKGILKTSVKELDLEAAFAEREVFAMPVFDMLESFLVTMMKFKPSMSLRFLTRTAFVAFTLFIGITFPFFGGLLSFFGGFAFAPTTYFLPCVMWLVMYKPKKFGLSWWANWLCIIVGVLLMVLSPIGALKNVILQAKDFKFYS